jgi:hypothetical protein
MDIKRPECFIAVAEERHFTRAALRLNVVQSGLSQTIRMLEDELGGPLLVRSTRRVDLTPNGKSSLEGSVQLLLDGATALLDEVNEGRFDGCVAIKSTRRKILYGKDSLRHQRIELSGSCSRDSVVLHLSFPDHVDCLNA